MNHTSTGRTNASKAPNLPAIKRTDTADLAGTVTPSVPAPSFDGTLELLHVGLKWYLDGKYKPHYRDTRPRPNAPGPRRDTRATRVRRQLGIPDHTTSGAAAHGSTLAQLRDWIGHLFTSGTVPQEPLPGCVFILDCPKRERPHDPAFSLDRYVKALGALYEPEHIHKVPIEHCNWLYTQNVVKPGPGGVMLLGQPFHESIRKSLDATSTALRTYFDANGHPYRVLPHAINWANVESVRLPDGTRLLVLTDIEEDCRMTPEAKDALVEAYDYPEHVLLLSMSREADKARPLTGTFQDDLCYDADLAFKPLTNAVGQVWALVRERCFTAVAYTDTTTGTTIRFQSIGEALTHLEIGVIPIPDEDAQQIPANSVSRGDITVFPQRVSEGLRKQISDAGIKAMFPEPGEELGNVDPRKWSLFAIHCMCAQRDDPAPATIGLTPDSDKKPALNEREL
jgi:hypothetical protein